MTIISSYCPLSKLNDAILDPALGPGSFARGNATPLVLWVGWVSGLFFGCCHCKHFDLCIHLFVLCMCVCFRALCDFILRYWCIYVYHTHSHVQEKIGIYVCVRFITSGKHVCYKIQYMNNAYTYFGWLAAQHTKYFALPMMYDTQKNTYTNFTSTLPMQDTW